MFIKIYLYFFIYAFLGWCTEVVYAALNEGKFINRGFLNGPYCPIYGFGVIAVVNLLTPIHENPFLLFLGSVFVTSAILRVLYWRKYLSISGGIIRTGLLM